MTSGVCGGRWWERYFLHGALQRLLLSELSRGKWGNLHRCPEWSPLVPGLQEMESQQRAQGLMSSSGELWKSIEPAGANSIRVVAFWLSPSPNWSMLIWPCCWTCGWTQSTDIIWEVVRNAESQAPPRRPEAESAFRCGALRQGEIRAGSCRGVPSGRLQFSGRLGSLEPRPAPTPGLPCSLPTEQGPVSHANAWGSS